MKKKKRYPVFQAQGPMLRYLPHLTPDGYKNRVRGNADANFLLKRIRGSFMKKEKSERRGKVLLDRGKRTGGVVFPHLPPEREGNV